MISNHYKSYRESGEVQRLAKFRYAITIGRRSCNYTKIVISLTFSIGAFRPKSGIRFPYGSQAAIFLGNIGLVFLFPDLRDIVCSSSCLITMPMKTSNSSPKPRQFFTEFNDS